MTKRTYQVEQVVKVCELCNDKGLKGVPATHQIGEQITGNRPLYLCEPHYVRAMKEIRKYG